MATAIEGTVRFIRFVNEDNYWTVAALSRPGYAELTTVVGNMPGLAEGMMVRCEGRWHEDPRYGRQLRVDHYVELVPATREGLAGYLASGLVSGIGPKMAERIVEHLGTDALDIIVKEPERLAGVPGIGKKRAATLVEAFQQRRGAQEAMIFLFGLGIAKGLAMRIYKRYREDTVATVRRKPYQLAEEVHGIGFHKADQVARGLDITRNDPGRLRAGVYHCLRTARDEGHCFVLRRPLVGMAADLLGVDEDDVAPAIAALAVDGKVVVERVAELDDDAVYLSSLHEFEVGAAWHLASLMNAPPPASEDVGPRLQAVEAELGLALAPGQRNAIELVLGEGLALVTGGPGTGKTTIIKALIQAAWTEPHKIALAAPTGRAAKRMSEATGHPAQTIHRLLEFSPMDGHFQRDETNPLEVELLIVDEASMVDLPLFCALVRALVPGTRLALVGDSDQLPPVGPGSPLIDLLHGGRVPVARLERIFRQGEGSAIVDAAHTINSGGLPPPTPPGTPLQDFYFIPREDPEAIRATIEMVVSQRIPERFGLDPVRDVQVLSPMRTGPIGIDVLNSRLQQLLNPDGSSSEIEPGRHAFRAGDKVMQIRNDYEKGVFNGDIGFVSRVDAKAGSLQVVIDDRLVSYERAQREDLVLAYAVTVHKAQGSEYPAVVMPVSTHHFKMLRRNLLYTGITRGKRLVVLVGTQRAMRIAVSACDVTARNTRLDDRLGRAIEGAILQ